MKEQAHWDVLVVDDEPVVGAGIRKVLEGDGLRVALATDAASALAHPAARTCRLAVCDLVLPDGSGIDLIRDLLETRPDLPLVLITGYATPEQRDLALATGAAAFLAKPFDDSELLDVIRGALSAGRAPAREGRS